MEYTRPVDPKTGRKIFTFRENCICAAAVVAFVACFVGTCTIGNLINTWLVIHTARFMGWIP